jgi:hypothetical protein
LFQYDLSRSGLTGPDDPVFFQFLDLDITACSSLTRSRPDKNDKKEEDFEGQDFPALRQSLSLNDTFQQKICIDSKVS